MNARTGKIIILFAFLAVTFSGCFYIEPPVDHYDDYYASGDLEPCEKDEEGTFRCTEEVLEMCVKSFWLVQEDCSEASEICWVSNDSSSGGCQ